MDKALKDLMSRVWKLNRVHVGPETDESMKILSEYFPDIRIHEYPSGAKCCGWEVPPAWEVHRARLKTRDGQVIVDVKNNPLHLFSYSSSFTGEVSREELFKNHMMTNENRPNDIPFHFRNQYRHWEKIWGFCIPYSAAKTLQDATYVVDIQTSFVPGTMKVADLFLEGKTKETIVLSGHWDHPALVNDGLAGCIASLEVLKRLKAKQSDLLYSYRVLLTPEIVGSVFYLGDHALETKQMKEGIFIAMPGATSDWTFQFSRKETCVLDKIIPYVLDKKELPFRRGAYQEFVGNDEIAFEAPGIDVPMVSLSRFPFPEYHMSADDLEHFNEVKYDEGVEILMNAFEILESNFYPQRKFSGLPCLAHPDIDLYLSPWAISQMSVEDKVAGDYAKFGKAVDKNFDGNLFVKNIWHYVEGDLSTLEISQKLGATFQFTKNYLERAAQKNLIDLKREPTARL